MRKNKFRKGLVVAVIVLFVGVGVFPNITGNMDTENSIDNAAISKAIIYVPDDYPTIQAAVDAAVSGDTIIVRDGTYTENVDVNKRLNIQSENGSNSTIVQATSSDPHVFMVTADEVNVTGFTIQYNGTYWIEAGMYINSDFNTISRNKIVSGNQYFHKYGIWVYNSSNNIVSENRITDNQYGVYISNSSFNNLIYNNTVEDNNGKGIWLYESSSNNITENDMIDNYFGIYLDYSSYNRVYENNITDRYGIRVWYSSYNNLSHNTFVRGDSSPHSGIDLYSSNNNVFFRNVIKRFSIGIFQGSGDNNSFSQNEIIRCISRGIDIYGNNNFISNNIIINSSERGIEVSGTSNCIAGNTIFNSWTYGGIFSHGYSNSIIGNTVIESCNGIYIKGFSNDTLITENTVLGGTHGIYLSGAQYSTITANVIENNSHYGIYLPDSASNKNNIIYHNDLINNMQNAYDLNINTWDNGYPSGGNYWDDYNGSDNDGDGIGDTPYPIPGGDNEDRYPLMEPWSGKNQPPVADANGPYSGCVGEEILFDASGSYDSDGSIIGYRWDWENDGNWDTDWLPNSLIEYAYDDEFHGQLKLEVIDDEGATDNDTANVDVTKPFYFIHITDTHIGYPKAKSNFEKCLEHIDSFEIKPEFIIISGDIVHYGDLQGFRRLLSIIWYQQFNDISNSHDMIRYCCPGNHDYYSSFFGKTGDLDNYYKYIDIEYDSENYRYSFTYLNTHFVSLNSGHDVGWESILPRKGSGLIDDDIIYLENHLDGLDGVYDDTDNSGLNKIIFMHHPVINCKGKIWKRWDNGIISQNKEIFLSLCDAYDVDLVLTGHTHQNKIYKRSDDGTNADGWDAPIICTETIYVQTEDCKKRLAFRKITITGDEVKVEEANTAP